VLPIPRRALREHRAVAKKQGITISGSPYGSRGLTTVGCRAIMANKWRTGPTIRRRSHLQLTSCRRFGEKLFRMSACCSPRRNALLHSDTRKQRHVGSSSKGIATLHNDSAVLASRT